MKQDKGSKKRKLGRPPRVWKDITVELEYVPGKDNEESLLRAFEMIFEELPPTKRKPRRQKKFKQNSLF